MTKTSYSNFFKTLFPRLTAVRALILAHCHTLSVSHHLHSGNHMITRQGAEPKPGTARLDGRDELGEIVGNDTESYTLGVLLYDSAERILGVFGHLIRFVQYDELIAGATSEKPVESVRH